MDQRVEKQEQRETRSPVSRGLGWLAWLTWQRIVLAAIIILAILEIGTYAFNWTWTGFKDNDTVWDYLQLLLLPIALAIVPIWFMASQNQQRAWLSQVKWIFLVFIAGLLVLVVGTYAFNWTWTGFSDHGHLWDWLSLLLVPVTVAALPIWYSVHLNQQQSQEKSNY